MVLVKLEVDGEVLVTVVGGVRAREAVVAAVELRGGRAEDERALHLVGEGERDLRIVKNKIKRIMFLKLIRFQFCVWDTLKQRLTIGYVAKG
jgi:hypothetical protein